MYPSGYSDDNFLGIFRRQRFLGIFRWPKFVGIFRYLFSLGMFPRTVPSEISEEIPTNSPRKCFFGMSSESLILGIPSEFSEEILLSDEKFPTTILVGMSSEYRYSEDIPTIFFVGIPCFLVVNSSMQNNVQLNIFWLYDFPQVSVRQKKKNSFMHATLGISNLYVEESIQIVPLSLALISPLR